jgi:hypothetical protein
MTLREEMCEKHLERNPTAKERAEKINRALNHLRLAKGMYAAGMHGPMLDDISKAEKLLRSIAS